MSNGTAARRKREAEADDFQRLLARLHPDDELLAWHTYEQLHARLVTFFQFDFPLEAHDLANETLDRVAQKPDSYPILNLAEFVFGVARNLRREAHRRIVMVERLAASASAMTHAPHGPKSQEDLILSHMESQRRLECLSACLRRISAADRALLFRYYPANAADLENNRLRLAAELGVRIGTLRTRVARLRSQLEESFQSCSGSSPKP